jgi:hypothetical protein
MTALNKLGKPRSEVREPKPSSCCARIVSKIVAEDDYKFHADDAQCFQCLHCLQCLPWQVSKIMAELGDDFKPLTFEEFRELMMGQKQKRPDMMSAAGLDKLFDEIDRDKGAHRVVLEPYS